MTAELCRGLETQHPCTWSPDLLVACLRGGGSNPRASEATLPLNPEAVARRCPECGNCTQSLLETENLPQLVAESDIFTFGRLTKLGKWGFLFPDSAWTKGYVMRGRGNEDPSHQFPLGPGRAKKPMVTADITCIVQHSFFFHVLRKQNFRPCFLYGRLHQVPASRGRLGQASFQSEIFLPTPL